MIKGFYQGFAFLFQGFSLIFQKGIRRFVLIPLFINIVIFSGAVWIAYAQYQSLMDQLLGWLPSWLSWIEWLLLPLFGLLILIIIYYTFSIVANFIAAPFNALLAEKVEAKLRGNRLVEEDNDSFLASIAKTLGSEVKKFFYMLKWLPLLLLLTVIPVVNIIAPFAWLLYGAWMYALQYSDFPMGNHGLYMKDELIVLRKSRWHAIGFGAATTIITIIPVLNFLAMPVAVSGATALWVAQLSR